MIKSKITILDDEIERLSAMQSVLMKKLPECELITFKSAPPMIDWLKKELNSLSLISLDHDLTPETHEAPDPGTGRDVADYLATQKPVCPIIIHSTNSFAASGMEWELTEAGWNCIRVVPYQDLT